MKIDQNMDYDEKILLGDIYIGMKGNVEKSRMVYRGVDDDFMNKMFFVVYEQLKEYNFTIFENTLINMLLLYTTIIAIRHHQVQIHTEKKLIFL